MDRSMETGFLLDLSQDTIVKEEEEYDDDGDPFNLRSMVHLTNSRQASVVDVKTDTLVQIEDDPWMVLDWDRLQSEASALAALAQEDVTDWDAIEVEASAVAGSIKFSNNFFSSSSPMSPLSLESPLSTIFSSGMSLDLLTSPPSSGLLKLSLKDSSFQCKPSSLKHRSPLTPANHIFNEKRAQSELKKTNYIPKKPSILTFPPKKHEGKTKKLTFSNHTANNMNPPETRHPMGTASNSSTRSISVPKKCAKKPSARDVPELRRSISNMSQSQLQSMKKKDTSSIPYSSKKSLTLPRKKPSKQSPNGTITSSGSKTNTTPSVNRTQGHQFGSSVVSSTPAHKSNASGRPGMFAQPALPSPIIKYPRFKK